MTVETLTHLDTLKIAAGSETILQMIEKITTSGGFNKEYEYLYSDVFVIFNQIYHNGGRLDPSIDNTLRDQINSNFDRMHYHISVAVELAAGVITAPGVGFEIDNAKDWSDKAQNTIKTLSDNPKKILKNNVTKRYVSGLQKASEDVALNVNDLIKKLFWAIIVRLDLPEVIKVDFEAALLDTCANLLALKDRGWQPYFALEGLKINFDTPGENDDLEKIKRGLQNGDETTGDIIGLVGLGIMVDNWKAKGVKPGRFFNTVLQRMNSYSPRDAEERTATSVAIEGASFEVSVLGLFEDVLEVIGLVLAEIGGIIEVEQLEKQLDKINSAKSDFNTNYNQLLLSVESVVQASEVIRKHTK